MVWENFAEYLTERLAPRGVAVRMSRKLDIAEENFSKYKSGRTRPKIERVIRIAKFFNEDPAELLALAGYHEEAIDWLSQKNTMPETVSLHAAISPVPVIGMVSAGEVSLNLEYTDQGFPPGAADEYIEVGDHGESDYALRVEGDSMSPLLPSNSIILASPEKKFIPKRLCVVRNVKGQCWVKQVIPYSKQFTLLSINPEYPPIYLQSKEVQYIHPVIWIKLP